MSEVAHGGNRIQNIAISRSIGFPDRLFEWQGLRLHTWKPVCKFGDSRENVLDVRGLPWRLVGNFGSRKYLKSNLFKYFKYSRTLAVVSIWSPISSNTWKTPEFWQSWVFEIQSLQILELLTHFGSREYLKSNLCKYLKYSRILAVVIFLIDETFVICDQILTNFEKQTEEIRLQILRLKYLKSNLLRLDFSIWSLISSV